VNAAVINTPECRYKIPKVGPKDTAGHGCVKPARVPAHAVLGQLGPFPLPSRSKSL
jgi:hypothetical protein